MAIKFRILPTEGMIRVRLLPQPARIKFRILQGGGGGSPVPTYSGPYTVTPTQGTQVLATDGYKMADDVTVNPIPSNYGLITWNGSFLTVS